MARLAFPAGFLWGTATSAWQVEGAGAARGESVWDRFTSNGGATADGSSGQLACDHFHRWQEDVLLMKRLGLNAYRFSIGWSRVMPGGRGPPDERALDFYDALVDLLLASGIRPLVTLNHWDLPQPLQDAGGWPARETCAAFVEYALAVVGRLGDRVRDWTTHNEPSIIAHLGWELGVHAPGLKDPAASLRAAHHLLLSHGQAVPALRSASKGARVGIVLSQCSVDPASPSEADREAARRCDGAANRWYLDPLFRGSYPADAVADRVEQGHLPAGGLPFEAPGDLETISSPTDWLGVNYYSRVVARSDRVSEEANAPRTVPEAPPGERTSMGWEIHPRGLYEVLLRLHRDYRVPQLHLTEIGAAFEDARDPSGRVADPRRIAFLRDHLREAWRAIAEGVPLAGCFVWSLLDNLEWQFGFTKRFGLAYVDVANLRRTPKDSAFWYRDVATANAVDDGGSVR